MHFAQFSARLRDPLLLTEREHIDDGKDGPFIICIALFYLKQECIPV